MPLFTPAEAGSACRPAAPASQMPSLLLAVIVLAAVAMTAWLAWPRPSSAARPDAPPPPPRVDTPALLLEEQFRLADAVENLLARLAATQPRRAARWRELLRVHGEAELLRRLPGWAAEDGEPLPTELASDAERLLRAAEDLEERLARLGAASR